MGSILYDPNDASKVQMSVGVEKRTIATLNLVESKMLKKQRIAIVLFSTPTDI